MNAKKAHSLLGASTLFVAAALAGVAHADVDGLTIRFGGGCLTDNTTGNCTIKVTATGTDLDTESVRLYTAADSTSALKLISSRTHALSSSGTALFRIKNVPGGCFQVRTGPNGNSKPDAKSRTKCE